MALAAGAMVFVSVHELTPMARRYGHLGWFADGVVVSLVVHRGLASAIGR
jgi:ZIP family zinc transporter